jgi:hypothetical protein
METFERVQKVCNKHHFEDDKNEFTTQNEANSLRIETKATLY